MADGGLQSLSTGYLLHLVLRIISDMEGVTGIVTASYSVRHEERRLLGVFLMEPPGILLRRSSCPQVT